MVTAVTSHANIASMLQTLRAQQAQASASPVEIGANAVDKPSFGAAVKNAVENVNDLQMKSRELQQRYERGEDLPLSDVVLGMQRSSLSFEATLQVRNKVLKAYEEIMNMPV